MAGTCHLSLCCLLKFQCMTLVLLLSSRFSLLLGSQQDGASALDQVTVITGIFLCSEQAKKQISS